MGLIKAVADSVGGIAADQWKEFFYCDALEANVLAAKGRKRVGTRSSNTKGTDNIISDGSVIVVATGQCMIIVEQGKIIEVCAEPGEFIYDQSSEPSVFSGNLSESVGEVFKNLGKRITFGGDAPKDQRVYYINTKELIGNKYGTPSPIPFRVVNERAGIDIDIAIRCFGEYSVRITNPLLFYTNVCGNVEEEYLIENVVGQMKTELLTALQPAFATISGLGIRYSALPGHTTELANALNEVLSARWRDLRGIEIVSFGVSSVKANEEDEQMIKELQRNVAFMDPARAAAQMVGAQASAMQAAAKNEGVGSAMAFMGMGMAANSGGINVQELFQMGQKQSVQQNTTQVIQNKGDTQWSCSCGAFVSGKFCPECGKSKPEASEAWQCRCGALVSGNFCKECGASKPLEEGWQCVCGTINKGKFCLECGAKKPIGVPQYKCDKCGWEPEKGSKIPKFCPECGDAFDDGDIKA